MPTKSETKQIEHVEAILGEKLGPGALGLINLAQVVAVSTQSGGITTQRNVVFNQPNKCFKSRVTDVSGYAQTLDDGRNVFRLSRFLCSTGGVTYALPINVVATPVSEKPFYVTVGHMLLNNGDDVEITLSSWDAKGNPAPFVTVNWRCRVEFG